MVDGVTDSVSTVVSMRSLLVIYESIHTRRQSKDYYPHFPDLEMKVKSQEKLQDLPVVLKLVNSSSRTQDPGLV